MPIALPLTYSASADLIIKGGLMRNFLAKPQNKWGWVRVTGIAGLAAVAAWALLAAVLRQTGEVSWLTWSGYPAFSLWDGLELGIVLMLSIMAAAWMEEQHLQTEIEQNNNQAAEQVGTARRKEIARRLHEMVLSVPPDSRREAAGIPDQIIVDINEMLKEALPELDGKGKGEILHFLFEKGLLTGENPAFKWIDINFDGAALHKAQLNGIHMNGVSLANARMDGAHLVNGRLAGADLSRAFLRHANLSGAVLTGSNLSGAHLDSANLEGADLTGACLEAAFLANANLKNCTVNGFAGMDPASAPANSLGSLDQAILVETILPDGRKVTNARGKEYLHRKELAILIDRL